MEREQMANALDLKVQRLRQQFVQSQSLKQQALEQSLAANESVANLQWLHQQKTVSTLHALDAQREAEQTAKHKLRLQSIVNENRRSEIQRAEERANLRALQIETERNVAEEYRKMNEMQQKQERLEEDRMVHQHRRFREKLKRTRTDALSQHKEELVGQLKERQKKMSEMAKKQRVQSFAAALKEEEEAAHSDLTDDFKRMADAVDVVQRQIQEIASKELELEMRGKEVSEQNAFERAAKDAAKGIQRAEQMKYAKIRENMVLEMQRKEDQLRERHDEMMAKLMKQREREILEIGNRAKCEVESEQRASLQQEFERNEQALKALEQTHSETQNAMRQSIARIPSNGLSSS